MVAVFNKCLSCRVLDRHTVELSRVNWVARKKGSMRPIDKQVAEYLNYCKNVRRMTDQTMQSKVHILETFAKLGLVRDMQEFDNRIAHKWIEMQLSGEITGTKVSGRTVNIRMAHMIVFCKYLRDMDYRMKLKIALIEKVEEDPPRRRWFTREQIELVLEHATQMERLLISLLFDSGLRAFELQNLKLENISGRHMKFIGKGRKAGNAWMTERTREWMDEWIWDKDINNYLWPSPLYKDGRPYSIDELRYICRMAFERVGIEGFYLHAMRHSFATDIQKNGATLDESKELLRHSNSSTTEIYLHGLDNKMDSVYDRLKNGKKQEIAIA